MKKVLLGIFSLAFVASATLALSMNNATVNADEAQSTSVFTETKVKISNNGEKMLVVTGIKDVKTIYQLGYEVNGVNYTAQEGETAQNNTYYQSLTLSGVTKTASEFMTGAEGLLVWELNYDSSIAYDIQPYAYVGVLEGDKLTLPDEEVKSYGALKEDFNVLTVTFADEDGTTIATVPVNYGAKVSAVDAPAKENAKFDTWLVNGEEFDFNTKITSNLTITADYAEMVNYTVKVLAPEYANTWVSPYHYAGAATYVDKTSEYASLFGLDEQNQAKAIAGTVVDLTAKIDTLKGAKLNAGSVVRATIAEEGTTELTVKLDFDNDELGFDYAKVGVGKYNWSVQPKITLAYINGVCGVLVEGTTQGYRQEVIIDVGEVKLADYVSYSLTYYEKKATVYNRLLANNEESTNNSGYVYITQGSTSNEYLKYSVNLCEAFSNVETLNRVKISLLENLTEKSLFITGIKKAEVKRQTITYSMDNGNILDIASPVRYGEISEQAVSRRFQNGSQGVDVTANSLYYKYEGEKAQGFHKTGLVFDLGGIRIADYKKISVVFHKKVVAPTVNPNGDASFPVWVDGVEIDCHYSEHASYQVDIIARATAKGITQFSELELSTGQWADTTGCEVWVAYIMLELKDGIPEDGVTPEEPEVPAGPQSVTYSVDNGNLADIVTPLSGGTLSTEANHHFGWTTTDYFKANALLYTLTSEEPIIGAHKVGLKVNLGNITLSDYKTIRIVYHKEVVATKEGGTADASGSAGMLSYCGTIELGKSQYSNFSCFEIDIKAAAEAKGLTTIDSLELSMTSWAEVTSCKIWIAYVELVVAD